MKYIPHTYQTFATQKLLDTPRVGLFLKPGLGKTVITLTALEELMHDRYEVNRTLIIAPKIICEDVWPAEIEKWNHLTLRYSLATGTAQQREQALKKKADVYIISRDNIAWLIRKCRKWPFDCIVIDELSNFKAHDSKRFEEIKRVLASTKRIIGLTGTPKPNGDPDLWAQIYVLDQGERLGKNITAYRNRYLYQKPHNEHQWFTRPGAAEEIEEKIKDICIAMTAEDYLNLPPLVVSDCLIHLPLQMFKEYKHFEKERVLEVERKEITAPSRAVVLNKLLQYASGAIYDEDRLVHHLHDLKIEYLQTLIDEINEPVIVFYAFKHEASRILEVLKDHNIRELKNKEDVQDWNEGKIQVLLAHPASCGYGLNLQAGGHHVIWFSLTWSQEQYEQANDRLYRQGQKETVIIHRLIMSGTVDELVRNALTRKDCNQTALFDALKIKVFENE